MIQKNISDVSIRSRKKNLEFLTYLILYVNLVCSLVLEDISVSTDDCLFGAGLTDVIEMRSV